MIEHMPECAGRAQTKPHKHTNTKAT